MFSNAVKIMLFILCTILCTYKTMLYCRKHPSIQITGTMKPENDIKMKLYLGCYRNRLEGG